MSKRAKNRRRATDIEDCSSWIEKIFLASINAVEFQSLIAFLFHLEENPATSKLANFFILLCKIIQRVAMSFVIFVSRPIILF